MSGTAPCAVGTVAATRRAEEILALTLWAEAGIRPVRAIEALAALVVNRARLAATEAAARLRYAPEVPVRPGSPAPPWPLLLGPVCRAPFLFACWKPWPPGHALPGEAKEGDPALAICRRIAARAAAGVLPDPTGGATHWHDAGTLPGWAIGLVPTAEIGGLMFYRAEAEAPPSDARGIRCGAGAAR